MRHLLFTILSAASVLLIGAAGTAQAQYYGPAQGPNYGPGYRGNISPYLNILRGRNVGIDYYLGTRSEFQRRRDAVEFRDDISDLDRRTGAAAFDEAPIDRPVQSGTPVTFGNTMGYYNNRQNYLAPTVGRMGAGIGAPAPARRSR
jgi:hypothetical protein